MKENKFYFFNSFNKVIDLAVGLHLFVSVLLFSWYIKKHFCILNLLKKGFVLFRYPPTM